MRWTLALSTLLGSVVVASAQPPAWQLTVPPQMPPVPVEVAADAPASPAPPGAETKPADAKPPTPEELAESLKKLSTSVETMSKKLTVLTASEDFKIILGGQIVADFIYSSARPVAPGTPFFLAPAPVQDFKQNTFDAHARQSLLTTYVMGPKICDMDSSALIVLSLYNDAIIPDRYGILPIQAFVQLKDHYWKFAAGLQFDVFNPQLPTMLPFSYLIGSGNTGNEFRGQARVEHYVYPTPDVMITFQGAISEALSTALSEDFRLSEDNGWPNLEGRIALAYGPLEGEGLEAKRPIEVGVSGVVGQLRTTNLLREQVVADIWGLGADFRWAITDRCGIKGEVFTGSGLGTYGGGIMQVVDPIFFEGIDSHGGFVEVYYYVCPEKVHVHLGYGVDDPDDNQLMIGMPMRNETVFANLLWDVTKALRLGWEVTYRQTDYGTPILDNDGYGFHTQVLYKF